MKHTYWTVRIQKFPMKHNYWTVRIQKLQTKQLSPNAIQQLTHFQRNTSTLNSPHLSTFKLAIFKGANKSCFEVWVDVSYVAACQKKVRKLFLFTFHSGSLFIFIEKLTGGRKKSSSFFLTVSHPHQLFPPRNRHLHRVHVYTMTSEGEALYSMNPTTDNLPAGAKWSAVPVHAQECQPA